ncbi:Uncharacterized protein Rs2_29027 [Raphanus sativus]|nr:Uncharacterized protein Rs2_29027 [Raphanus sativus]
MASSYFEKPQEEEDHIDDESYEVPPFDGPPVDIRILTSEQRVGYYRAQSKKENWWLSNKGMACWIRDKLIRERLELEGMANFTMYEWNSVMNEIDVALELREAVLCDPPPQLEGTCNPTLELHFEDICSPCVEDTAPNSNSLVLINECLDLICETRKLDELRIEKLARDHIEVCFDKSYLCASFDFESEFLFLMNLDLFLLLLI